MLKIIKKEPHSMLEHMFHLQIPLLEKIIRPIIVYACLILLLRVFGKRELAQLNPFDLVVLLSLSNTVQNALIGDDNSITGGIVGAISLLTINYCVVRLLYSSRKLEQVVEGTEQVLIRDGKLNDQALKSELLTQETLLSAIRKQNFNDFSDVKLCTLLPNGSFSIEGYKPSEEEKGYAALVEKLAGIEKQIAALQR